KGEQHFFKILTLNAGGMIKNVCNFGESVNNGFNFWPKQMLNISKADIRIFHSIVQQSCYNGCGAKTDFFSYNSGYRNWVINIRLAGFTTHVFVRLKSDIKSLANITFVLR